MSPDPVVIKADGREIAVEDSGRDSGFPIIMMNGSGSRHLFWPAAREGRDLGFRLIGTNIEENDRAAAYAWLKEHL